MQISLSELSAKVATAMVTHQIQFKGNCKLTASAPGGEGVKRGGGGGFGEGGRRHESRVPMWGLSAAMMMQ